MSINTIGGVDITTIARLKIDDTDSSDSSGYSYSDANLNEILSDAVRQYSNYLPYKQEATISHVADQDLYELPSGIIRVDECWYRLDFDTTVYESAADTTLAGYSTYAYPALDTIRRMLRVKYDEIGKGHYEVVTCTDSYTAGKYLLLFPAPTTSTGSFTVRYTMLHPLAGTDYHTIPPEHAPLFVKLLQAYVYDIQAAKYYANPLDYDAGQTRVRRGGGTMALERRARSLEAEVWNALRSPIISIG